jgi:hypothetical protein
LARLRRGDNHTSQSGLTLDTPSVVSSTSDGSIPAESWQEQFAPESTAEYNTSWSLQSGLERHAGSGNPTNALSLAQSAGRALLYPTQSWLQVQQPHLTHYEPPPAAFNSYFSSQWPDNDRMRSSHEMESAKVYGYNRQMPPSEMWFADNIQNLNSAAPLQLVNTRHNFAETKIDNPWSSLSSTSSMDPEHDIHSLTIGEPVDCSTPRAELSIT